jgi:cell wall hydrolase
MTEPFDFILADPADILARTLCGEARGEGEVGMQSVANVVMNRVAKPCWWGRNIKDVCLKPFQFSCWNENDPNLPIILNLNDGFSIFTDSLAIAQRAVAGTLEDITGGATSYYAASMDTPPRWAEGKTPCARIGGQLFFKDI